jgi:hypothetical protein
MPITTTPYGFIPTQVSGLVLWLDASDATTITQSSGNISQWRDKSTSALTATATNNPTLIANIQNGFPGISFDGSTQYFNLGNNLNMGTNQIYIFVVSKFNSTADGAIIGKSLYGPQAARYSLIRSGAMIPLIEASGGAVNNSGLNSDTSTSARLLNMVWDRSTIYLYQNGSSVFSVGLSDSSNLTNGDSLLIGAYQNGSGGTPPVAGLYMNGYIHEILMYLTPISSPLGDTARQQIESYLAQKWGLTLGAGHPGLTSTVYRSTYLKNPIVKTNIARMTPFYTAFTPRQIWGLALWLDAADPAGNGVIPANNTTLTVWKDKSGIGNDATAYGSPKYNSRYISFSASTSDYVRTTAYLTITQNVTTVFYVAQLNSDPALFNDLIAFTDIAWGSYTGANSIRYYQGLLVGTVSKPGDTYDFGLNNYYINGTFNPSTTPSYSTPHIVNSVSQNTSGSTRVSVSDTAFSRYFTGNVYEVLIYNSVISSTQRQQVESYLAQKWGLTSSLPGGHLNATQPAGAVTALSLVNSKMTLTKTGIVATGGTITIANGYKIHTFTSVGSTNFVVTSGGTAQVLVAGGGGGGGGAYTGGGGGAGGAIFNSAFSIATGTYSVTVGALGAGWAGDSVASGTGSKGGDSIFSSITGYGGGGGGDANSASYNSYMDGGCGGGAGGPAYTTYVGVGSQGGNGGAGYGPGGGFAGTGCGGGGGMGGKGVDCVSGQSGAGGPGATYTIGGSSYLICAGGGGGGYTSGGFTRGLGGSGIGGAGGTMNSLNGFPATYYGSGGGGSPGNSAPGGNGYQGIVIIAYRV